MSIEMIMWPALESLLLFVLCAYGLTQLLCFSKLLDRIRPKHYFFSCPMCVGFWVGVFLWGVNGYTELFSFGSGAVTAFMCGCISAGTSYFLSMLVEDYGIRFKIHKGEDK